MGRAMANADTEGRWRGILRTLGVDSKTLSGKNVPCPFCGGKDRFRFGPTTKFGAWICNQCGSGAGIDLVMRLRNLDRRAAWKLVLGVADTAPKVEEKPIDETKRRERLNDLWGRAKLLTLDDPAGRYLQSRGIVPPLTGTALRWSQLTGAMLARVCGSDGKPVTLQQTFITPEGEKRERRTFWGRHPWGSAVRLAAPEGERLGIAEGVETALSAAFLFGVPTWAALDARHLERWEPPSDIKAVEIFGDNDESFTGQAAAYNLAKRLKVQNKLDVAVHVPTTAGTDWNDALRLQGTQA